MGNGYDGEFAWNSDFKDAVQQLNHTNASFAHILHFFNRFGTHLLSQMATGSVCTASKYFSKENTWIQVEEYQYNERSVSADFGYLTSTSTWSNSQTRTGTTENGVKYSVGDVFCRGETIVSSSQCAGVTSTVNKPVVVAYELIKIWEVKDVASWL